MTHIELLKALKAESLAATADLLLAVAPQREDKAEPEDRAPEVYLTHLNNSSAAKKKAPYILHQVITSKSFQCSGEHPDCIVKVRSIFATYNEDEEEGGLALLNMMERLRIAILRKPFIGDQFTLDLDAGMEILVYPDNIVPYFAGEMVTTWHLPGVEREARQCL